MHPIVIIGILAVLSYAGGKLGNRFFSSNNLALGIGTSMVVGNIMLVGLILVVELLLPSPKPWYQFW